jgi:hypothetical protein
MDWFVSHEWASPLSSVRIAHTENSSSCTTYKSSVSPSFAKQIKNLVRPSQENRYASATKTNRLILFRETIVICFENHKKHTNALCEQKEEFQYVKAGGTFSNH